MIHAVDVSFAYGTSAILAGVALDCRPGEMVGLIGPNGSGKSTLLQCLHGALTPSAGSVIIGDEDVNQLTTRAIATRVAVVAQDSTAGTALNVAELVLLGRSPHRRDYQSFSADDRRIAAEALEQVGALALADRQMGQLSGGERQRVAIARCLAQGTPALLLDEPTNHLDIRYQHEVLQLVRSLGLTTIIVLHDLNLAARYCDHVVLVNDQRIVRAGTVDQVLQPEVLEPVYGIAIRRIDEDGVHLIFGA